MAQPSVGTGFAVAAAADDWYCSPNPGLALSAECVAAVAADTDFRRNCFAVAAAAAVDWDDVDDDVAGCDGGAAVIRNWVDSGRQSPVCSPFAAVDGGLRTFLNFPKNK